MNLFIIIGNVLVLGVLAVSCLIARRAASHAEHSDHAPFRRRIQLSIQIASFVVLIGIALIPLGFLDSLLIGAPFQTEKYYGLGSASNSQLENRIGCTGSSGVELTVTILRLDSAQDTANADVALCVGDQVLKNLTVIKTGARPLSNGLDPLRVDASFSRLAFRVFYDGSTPETFVNLTVPIASILKQKDPSGLRGPVDLGLIRIPVLGNVVSYPFDSYSASGLWAVSPPAGTEIITSTSIRFNWTPAPLDVAATPNAGNLAWHWGYVQSVGDVIEANRITPMKFFVFLIAGLPLLLFVGLLVLVWSTLNNSAQRRFPAELLIGVGAFLLAIIPVRTVLVPAEISQITVTDYLLGTEMAVMVAASLIIVLAGSMNLSGEAADALDKEPERGSDASPAPGS
jgi:hypothetical protein